MPQTNFFGQLLLELSDFIKAQIPEIKWIDQDLGQLETFEYRPEVAFPCVLIDFAAASYSDLSELAQFGDVTVILRIAVSPFSQSHQSAPMNVREKALEYYALEQKVYEAVQGWQNEFTQPFRRVGADTEQRNQDGLRIRILTFNTAYEDYSAGTKTTKASVTLSVQREII